MKTVLYSCPGKLLLGGFLLLLSCSVPRYPVQPVSFTVEPEVALLERGRVLVNLMCADCHRNPSSGKLSGKYLADVPKVVGKLYSANITQDPEKGIGKYTAGQLAYLLRTGIGHQGKFVPMMAKPGLADNDLKAVIAYLKYSDDAPVQPESVQAQSSRYSLPGRIGMRVMMKPFDYPKTPVPLPAPGDVVAQGRYLVNILGCFECHSRNPATVNKAEPEKTKGYLAGGAKLRNLEGHIIRTPNITMDTQSGIGRWTKQEFAHAIRSGQRPDGSPIQYPMPNYGLLSRQEADAIYSYLKTVPPVKHVVKP